ncbi:acyl carrier protein [Pendulispora albinea]|uniref:Phosphopantetheine-binding protein n=1 Tax=Pendulispora albinea TaxID=2741071 RepID=A0ABZ2M037_9BACT
MDKNQIEEMVFAVVSQQFNVPIHDVTPKILLIDDLGADSAALVEFSARLEDTFKTEFPDLRYLADKDLGELIDFISNHGKLNAATGTGG